ncbi:MAG: hypothetical protein RSI32_06660 [Clostridia bacterium]
MNNSGVMTEREWRKHSIKMEKEAKSSSHCWGAQCMLVQARRKTLVQDRSFHAFLLLLSFTVALFMPVLVPAAEAPLAYPEAHTHTDLPAKPVRSVNAISYAVPFECSYRSQTYTREQLLRGKLLVMNEAHPMPRGVPAPNTLSIATYGKGMVPVGDLSLKSGRETITALQALFSALRGRGIGGLAIWRGTQSPAEQCEAQLEQFRAFAKRMPLKEAMVQTRLLTDAPRMGEMQQEYTVEILLSTKGATAPDERALGDTPQGRALLQTAWRYGFIRPHPNAAGSRAYRFRLIGAAHATAMTYLDLDFESYLALLHQKRKLSIKLDGKLRYIILCEPMKETHVEFMVPENAILDASLDNLGYAVVACTLK